MNQLAHVEASEKEYALDSNSFTNITAMGILFLSGSIFGCLYITLLETRSGLGDASREWRAAAYVGIVLLFVGAALSTWYWWPSAHSMQSAYSALAGFLFAIPLVVLYKIARRIDRLIDKS